jgi:hypothetical protein
MVGHYLDLVRHPSLASLVYNTSTIRYRTICDPAAQSFYKISICVSQGPPAFLLFLVPDITRTFSSGRRALCSPDHKLLLTRNMPVPQAQLSDIPVFPTH